MKMLGKIKIFLANSLSNIIFYSIISLFCRTNFWNSMWTKTV